MLTKGEDNMKTYLLATSLHSYLYSSPWNEGELPGYIPVMIDHCIDWWQKEYPIDLNALPEPAPRLYQTTLQAYAMGHSETNYRGMINSCSTLMQWPNHYLDHTPAGW